jgi:hypothetical protein
VAKLTVACITVNRQKDRILRRRKRLSGRHSVDQQLLLPRSINIIRLISARRFIFRYLGIHSTREHHESRVRILFMMNIKEPDESLI